MTKNNAHSTHSSTNGSGFGYGLLLGALGGMAAYVLFGTTKGRRAQEELKEIYRQLQSGEKSWSELLPNDSPITPSSIPVIKQSPNTQATVPLNHIQQAKSMLEMLAEKVQLLSNSETKSPPKPPIAKRTFKKK